MLRVSYGLVQATVGVGAVLIWYFCVAYAGGGVGQCKRGIPPPTVVLGPFAMALRPFHVQWQWQWQWLWGLQCHCHCHCHDRCCDQYTATDCDFNRWILKWTQSAYSNCCPLSVAVIVMSFGGESVFRTPVPRTLGVLRPESQQFYCLFRFANQGRPAIHTLPRAGNCGTFVSVAGLRSTGERLFLQEVRLFGLEADELDDAGHVAFVVFDKDKKQFFKYDPNGTADWNHAFLYNSEAFLIEYYTNLFEVCVQSRCY